jgi:hypothetical protein
MQGCRYWQSKVTSFSFSISNLKYAVHGEVLTLDVVSPAQKGKAPQKRSQ